jgi:hypothetical protein
MLKESRYTPGQIDSDWTEKIKDDFMKWLAQNPDERQITKPRLEEFMKKRTW